MPIEIMLDDLSGPEVADLLRAHMEFSIQNTPNGSGHVLDIEALKHLGLTFWSAWDDEAGGLIGCVAMQELAVDHGEIKSMHTQASARRSGIGRALVKHVIEEARQRGYRRLSLETGRGDGFSAARKLYESLGFEACDCFGAYADDPFSYCMTRGI